MAGLPHFGLCLSPLFFLRLPFPFPITICDYRFSDSLLAQLRCDKYRTDIRRIRDELFDYMWKEGHDFSTPAYRSTRESLNGLLRICNLLSPTLLIVSVAWDLARGQRLTATEE